VTHRVTIVGGGFGGLAAARALRRAPVDITLVDRRNFHLFQPLLYQVATGELSPANIASPLRGILRHQRNCRVVLGEAVGFDPAGRRVLLADGEIPWDTLIVAAGATHTYFGRDDWAPLAPGLKTIEDATEIRKHLLFAFEAAERLTDRALIAEWLTFVIVGGGPTGIELAGALSEIAHHTLKHDFRHIDPKEARIVVVEAAPHPLAMYPPELVARARHDLDRHHVVIRGPDGQSAVVRTHTVVWAAGVVASPLGPALAAATGAPVDRAGRVVVEPDLSLPGRPDIFVVGDLASFAHQGDKPLPGLAPVAMQQGRYVARLVDDRLRGRPAPAGPFRYHDRGSMAVIGRYSAIALIKGWKLGGFLAWAAWVFLHLMEITQFRNRILVLIQWGWTFLTRDRAARLITGPLPHDPPPDDGKA
jgi:NADH dehydrogenase